MPNRQSFQTRKNNQSFLPSLNLQSRGIKGIIPFDLPCESKELFPGNWQVLADSSSFVSLRIDHNGSEECGGTGSQFLNAGGCTLKLNNCTRPLIVEAVVFGHGRKMNSFTVPHQLILGYTPPGSFQAIGVARAINDSNGTGDCQSAPLVWDTGNGTHIFNLAPSTLSWQIHVNSRLNFLFDIGYPPDTYATAQFRIRVDE